MTGLLPERLAELDGFLLQLNAAAGEAILPLFRADHGLDDKGEPGAFDPVTEADRGAEAAIRRPFRGIGRMPHGRQYLSIRPFIFKADWVIRPGSGLASTLDRGARGTRFDPSRRMPWQGGAGVVRPFFRV